MLIPLTQSIKLMALFFITAFFEIIGCYLFLKFMKEEKRFDYLFVSLLFLALFSWLLTFHTLPSGRVYAAYGGIYVSASFLWLYFFDKASVTMWDITGVTACIIGALIIYFQP